MKIVLQDVSKGKKGQSLPPTSLAFETGAAVFTLAETEQRPTVLGLIASGRMRPDTGLVTIDGRSNAGDLRRRVALVDAQVVSDPPANVALAGVVGEELMFAGLGATPVHARRWLSRLGYTELASVPIGDVDPLARVRILCELAVLRKGVEGIVLVRPDRHGGRPDGWWRIAREFAERGYAMLVVVGGSAAVAIERMPNVADEPAVEVPAVEPAEDDGTPPEPADPAPEPEPELAPEPISAPDPETTEEGDVK